MSCDYCKGTKCVISMGELDGANDVLVFIEERDGSPQLVLVQDCGSVDIITRDEINFCPMCGEKMGGER